VEYKMLTKWIPRIALLIAITAFIFQVTVLYPWHIELSKEISSLARNVKKI
jgi:hypothetical protein